MAFADGPTPMTVQTIGAPFSGLNNQDNSLILPPSQAQDLLNVDITPGGRSVKRRKGYGLDATLNMSTGPVHGAYHFYDASGNDIRLWANDVNVSGSVNNAAYTILVTSMTVASTLQCADSQGLAYCVDSSRDFLLRTNGATILWRTDILGKTITASADRLVVADLSGDQNSLHFSAQGDFTNFTAGALAASPFTESILAPGSHITHIRYAFGRYLWWKDNSFGYVIGTDQTNVQVVIVSYLVGTLDNTSVENEGIVYFRGNDNHIWAYDGANLTRLTREITPTVTAANTKKTNSWTQSSSSDFSGGNLVSSVTYSANLAGVAISTDNVNFPNPCFASNLNNWTSAVSNTWIDVHNGSPGGSNCTGTYSCGTSAVEYPLSVITWSNMAAELDTSPGGILISSTSFAWTNNSCSNITRTLPAVTSKANALVTLKLFPVEISSHTLTTDAFVYSGNAITFTSASDTSAGTRLMWIDNFQGGKTDLLKGIYYGAVKQASSITSWSTFNATVNNSPATPGAGTHTFSVRSQATTFNPTDTTPAWTPQTNNAQVAAGVNQFFQMSDTFTVVAASETPTLNSYTFNWNEGSAADKAYATYFDFGIWWSISTGTVTTNNIVLRYDLINGVWTVYSMPSDGFLVQGNSLFFGDSTTGKVYKFGSGDNDNGAAINAYWKSKDFSNVGTGGATGVFGYNPNDSPFIKKDFRILNTFIASQPTGTMNVTYSVDRSTTTTSYSFAMLDPNGLSTTHSNYYLPTGTKGYTFNVQYGNNVVDQPWELFGGQLTYQPGQWYPYP